VATVAGVACIMAGLTLATQIYVFYRHSDTVGAALIHQQERSAVRIRAAGRCTEALPPAPTGAPAAGSLALPETSGTPTPTATTGSPTVYALLRVTKIGLVAPIVQGADTPELSVAVGHLPASSWPGPTGTSVLAAHDVTWFSQIDQLAPGDDLSVVTACQTYVYTVDSHEVVQTGSIIDQTSAPRLVLTTCYPTNALFLTSQRYVLFASLTRILDSGSPTGTTATAPVPEVPAPAALVAQGLDLQHNSAPLGSLVLTGSPSPEWSQSTAPLDDEAAVLSLYFAALRSASQNQQAWWAAVAPGVPFTRASPLVASTVTFNASVFDPVLDVDGATLVGASLSTRPVLAGNARPGSYQITMQATVVGGQLVVAGWTMTSG
jgi:sortase A